MRLGVMGGTFDPIHIGHLRAAETAREALQLDQVLFVPAGQPPHRDEPRASPQDRLAMVGLATAENSGFAASDVELQRQGPSYTVDTLGALRSAHPADQLVLIVGSDTFPEMQGWREAGRVFELSAVAVVTRPGVQPPLAVADRVHQLAGPALEVSASAIRELLRRRRSVRYLVPAPVAHYIEQRGLYR